MMGSHMSCENLAGGRHAQNSFLNELLCNASSADDANEASQKETPEVMIVDYCKKTVM